MKNVKLSQVGTEIQISELISATAVVSGRSTKDVFTMVLQDFIHPTQYNRYTLDLQCSRWRVGDWFDDALKHLLLCNRITRLTIVADR